MVDRKQLDELLYQALETEMGGVQIYRAAIACAVNEDLRDEWKEYLTQTRQHEKTLRELMTSLELDPEQDTPGRSVVRSLGESLLQAIQTAAEGDDPTAAELVATECVVLAETKDHLNWQLLGHAAKSAKGNLHTLLAAAHDAVEDEEDEHLYHSTGWCRELWMASLGIPAVLPPPEEEKNVKSALGAARAKQAREKML